MSGKKALHQVDLNPAAVLDVQDNRSSLILQMILSIPIFLMMFAALPARAEHIHHLYFNNVKWVDQDLTQMTGGALVASESSVAAFYTTPNHQFHVYYSSATKHIHQLYFNGSSWVEQDLTALTSGPLALGTGVAGFAVGNLQHVFYLGNDLHVHQLYYNNVSWADQDITVLAGGPVTDFNSLVAFTTIPNGQFHVYYLQNNLGHIHELLFNGTSWSDQDITAASSGEWSDRGWMTGFATGIKPHLFFVGFDANDDRHLNRLYRTNSKWVDEDLSAKVSGLPISPASGLASFSVSGTNLEAYCVTNDFDVHQLTLKNGHWTDIDLTALTGGPIDGSINAMIAFKTPPDKHFHLYYEPNDVYQLQFNGTSWSDDDLTTLTSGGLPNGFGGMGGFAIKTQQHVFYVALGN
jgi:hypothetical protein